jgi:cell division inhibitor SepF
MGLFDNIKKIMSIPEEDEFDEEIEEVEEKEAKKKVQPEQPQRREATPRVLGGGKAKTVNFNQSQMQVVLVKPDRFEDVSSIADHLNDKKTVVLNLESCERDVSRRIIDFLSGVAYANHGNIRKVAVCTFIIVPTEVDVMGEVMLEDFEENRMYF